MPEIPNVLPGGETESDWANLIRDRIIQRYTTASARDASVPSPVAGELSYLQDIQAVEVYDGSGWVPIATNNYGQRAGVRRLAGLTGSDLTLETTRRTSGSCPPATRP